MAEMMTVSIAARELERRLGRPVPPRAISDIFYQRRLPDCLAPIVGGRRLINEDGLRHIEQVLRQQLSGPADRT